MSGDLVLNKHLGIFFKWKRPSSNALVGNREILLDLNRKIYLNFYHLSFYIKEHIEKMKNKEAKKEKWKYSWAMQALFITFALSLIFSFLSTNAINSLSLIPAIIILLLVIALGVITDIIGVAVTVGSEEDFHAKASKKIEGAKSSVKLIRNSAKVANICCDVIGDICGVLSGAISAMLAVRIATVLHININMHFLIGAVVAAVTVSSKAAGKVIGQEHSTEIVHVVGKMMNRFIK